ncbi:ABC transporter ATP-binding protein [Nitzschia inconspicua]|uniref:ABC transporter ATP-binding protein n=1 Tax=Nitzschia inconspicua TaxID=303405 RepID=A0A9K3PV68_9STRA|nr:ABC transporter ATP-binding protein [Nitzschia inconspicua]
MMSSRSSTYSFFTEVDSFLLRTSTIKRCTSTTSVKVPTTVLFGKKNKRKQQNNRGQPAQEKQSVQDQRFDAATRQFMFTLVGLTKILPDKSKKILDNINLSFYPGAKIGIVGLNGSGKSTLLKIMAGVDSEYDGLARPLPGAKIGYLPQEPSLDEFETVQEAIDQAVQSSRDILDQYNELSLKLADPDLSDSQMQETMDKIESLTNKIDAGNLWELDRVVERAMDSLRVPPGDASIKNLSGGEKRRTALCQLLLGSPDMILADEPTNDLDAESVAWLEQFLDQYAGTVVCITHDRYFLNNVAGWILELDRGKGIPHEGNYESFLEAKTKRLEEEQKQQSAADKAVANELEWIRSNPKAKGNKSKARLSRYDELLVAAAPKELRNAGQIYIPPGPRLGNEVIEVKNLRKSFGDRLLIDDLSFSLPPAGIVGVVGPNGAGKSTLINMLIGKEQPDSGTIKIGETVKLVSVGQKQMEDLDPSKTVFEEISEGLDEIELGTQSVASRAYLSWFGFKGQSQQAKVENLSGGERSRVQLAKLLKAGGNLLCLDEPSNNIDESIKS